MMKLMNHLNVMRIYDVFEGLTKFNYVVAGELFDFLVNRGLVPPDESLAYFEQNVYGLNYVHTFSIIRRDPKPENILIASRPLPSPNSRLGHGENSYGPPTTPPQKSTTARNTTHI
jgi:serine/threonine protein kinase